MTKLTLGEKPRLWTITHVKEIVFYLTQKNINVRVYKDLKESRYILEYKNLTITFKSSQEIGTFLEPIYTEQKLQEKENWLKIKLQQELLKITKGEK